MYNTVCQNCHRRSERDSDFLEIEVNLEVSPALYPASLGRAERDRSRTTPLWRNACQHSWNPRHFPVTTSRIRLKPPPQQPTDLLSLDTSVSSATVCRMRSDLPSCMIYRQSYISLCSALSTISRLWSARSLSRRSYSRLSSTWTDSSGLKINASSIRSDTRKRARTCTSSGASSCIRARARIMGTMRRKCSTKSMYILQVQLADH